MADEKKEEECVRVVITGANRGLGFEFSKQLLQRKNYHIVACCRTPSKAAELHKLAEANVDRVTILQLDVTNDDHISSLVAALQNKAIDILLLNAGIISTTKMGTLQRNEMLNMYNINVVGPMLIGQALYSNVKLSKRKQIVGLSTGFASIVDCGSNSYVEYRASKAAMNMAFQSFARESEKNKDGVHTILVEPGWVQTDMGGKHATATPPDAVREMLDNVIDKYQTLESGGFYSRSGKPFAEKTMKKKVDEKKTIFAW